MLTVFSDLHCPWAYVFSIRLRRARAGVDRPPVAVSMTTAARASTRGAGGAAAAGIAIHPTTRASARTREGNHRWRERTPVGCPNPWKKRNTLDRSGREEPGRRRAATGAAAG